jgi:hypothetical protein
VHCVRVSNDDKVYVCDRQNNRIQVFRQGRQLPDEFRVEVETRANGSVWDMVLSHDPAQKYMYVADGANGRIYVLQRADGKVAGLVRPHRPHGGRVQVDPQPRHRPRRQPVYLGGRLRPAHPEVRAQRRRILNPLKDKLARGELAASMTVRLVSSVEIVRIAKTAGFDAIYIDLEHSSFSIETTCQISVMALEAGMPGAGAACRRAPRNTSRACSTAARSA